MSGTVNVDTIKNSLGTGGPDLTFGGSGLKFPSSSVNNLGFSASVATNALTINLTQGDGSTNPSTGTGAVTIGVRSSTLSSGGYNQRSVTSATSIIVPSGATLGLPGSSLNCVMWVYALDNAGTIELAVSARLFREDTVVTTTAISGSSTSFTTMYSTSARTSVSFRLIGKLFVPQATAGTWTAVPTQIQVNPLAIVQPITYTAFTSGSSATYTIPAGATWLRVFMTGGGGGGAASGTNGTQTTGTAGNATTFGSCSASGGSNGAVNNNGGGATNSNTISGAIGSDLQGNSGTAASPALVTASAQDTGGYGGASTIFSGGQAGAVYNSTANSASVNTGAGGSGAGIAGAAGASPGSGGGSGGSLDVIYADANMLSQFTYTVGSGGAAGLASSGGSNGGAGGSGKIVIEEHYD